MFGEIRNDFYDDVEKCWCIDGWLTDDDNEDGIVVARVYDDGRVVYTEYDYFKAYDVLDAVEECQKEVEAIEGKKEWKVSFLK